MSGQAYIVISGLIILPSTGKMYSSTICCIIAGKALRLWKIACLGEGNPDQKPPLPCWKSSTGKSSGVNPEE